DAVDEQIALAVLTDDVAGIDAAVDAEIDRFTPRTFDPVGPDREDRPVLAVGIGRNINEVTAVVLREIDRPDRAEVAPQRGPDGTPVHQVAAVPNDQAR